MQSGDPNEFGGMMPQMPLGGADDDLFKRQYPSPQMTAAEFEQFVVEALEQTQPLIDQLRVTLHDVIQGSDGVYDFDATVRFKLGNIDFLVVAEAKRYSHPVKREIAQILHSKMQAVGAQKAIIISTAPFQRGAVQFAIVHGMALVRVTEGRFTYQTRGSKTTDVLTREDASRDFGIPTFVGHCYTQGSNDSVRVTLITDQPQYAATLLFGVKLGHGGD